MEIVFLVVLMLIAFLYSSIGHGGASGYLALMALFSMDPFTMRTSALILNLFVAGTSFILYYRAKHFKFKLLWPFAISSMPAAYFGAQLSINPTTYKIILGIFLIIAVARMVFTLQNSDSKIKEPPFYLAIIIGAILGFFSGMIGIGGGIILSPILLLLNWANVKEASAVAAAFIFLNSTSGLVGAFNISLIEQPSLYIWIATAFTGGLLGSYFGSMKYSIQQLTYLLSFVLLMASFKLFFF